MTRTALSMRQWRDVARTISVLSWNIALICLYLLVTGTLQAWWYSFRLWLARHRSTINYDRLRLERRKYEAGIYQDDTRAADAE